MHTQLRITVLRVAANTGVLIGEQSQRRCVCWVDIDEVQNLLLNRSRNAVGKKIEFVSVEISVNFSFEMFWSRIRTCWGFPHWIVRYSYVLLLGRC